MTQEELKEALAVAGRQFDGHVTHGSIEAQIKVINLALSGMYERGYKEGQIAERSFQDQQVSPRHEIGQ